MDNILYFIKTTTYNLFISFLSLDNCLYFFSTAVSEINSLVNPNLVSFIVLKTSLQTFIFFAFISVFLGLALNKKNLLKFLIFFEIGLLVVALNFLYYSFFNPFGQVYVLIILAIAAAETSIGLSILILRYKKKKKITFNQNSFFKDNI